MQTRASCPTCVADATHFVLILAIPNRYCAEAPFRQRLIGACGQPCDPAFRPRRKNRRPPSRGGIDRSDVRGLSLEDLLGLTRPILGPLSTSFIVVCYLQQGLPSLLVNKVRSLSNPLGALAPVLRGQLHSALLLHSPPLWITKLKQQKEQIRPKWVPPTLCLSSMLMEAGTPLQRAATGNARC